MEKKPADIIAQLIMRDLSRDAILGIEESLVAGARRAYLSAANMRDGHLPHVLGQLRHFNMNETFHDALLAAGASPTQLRGNSLVVGHRGILTFGRFNCSSDVWTTARRSAARREISRMNRAVQMIVQTDLFTAPLPISEGCVFFVGVFSGSIRIQPDAPLSIDIVVPDKDMKGWLFRESLSVFLARYETKPVQRDGALPQLKIGIGKKATGQ